MTPFKVKNKDLKEQMEATLSKQNKNINDLEQYTRINSVTMYGLHDKSRFETALETALLVTSIVKNKLCLDVSVSFQEHETHRDPCQKEIQGFDYSHTLGFDTL